MCKRVVGLMMTCVCGRIYVWLGGWAGLRCRGDILPFEARARRARFSEVWTCVIVMRGAARIAHLEGGWRRVRWVVMMMMRSAMRTEGAARGHKWVLKSGE